jgi:hypothetical protein
VDLATGSSRDPVELFRGRYRLGGQIAGQRSYDVSPDGQRFLMIKPRSAEERREVVIVLNFFEELKRLVPN